MTYASKEKRNEYSRAYYAKNREKWVGYNGFSKRRNPEKAKLTMRSYMLRTQYGLSVEDFGAMLEKQGGKCLICGTDSPGGKGNQFQVDHCHASGKVRGLLCAPCNMRLGWFEKYADKVTGYLK